MGLVFSSDIGSSFRRIDNFHNNRENSGNYKNKVENLESRCHFIPLLVVSQLCFQFYPFNSLRRLTIITTSQNIPGIIKETIKTMIRIRSRVDVIFISFL